MTLVGGYKRFGGTYPPTKLHDIITQDTMWTVMLECIANTVGRYYDLILRKCYHCFENTSGIHR